MFFLFIPVILYALIKKIFFSASTRNLLNKHVVITGGSSGIGKSVATLAVQQGANVTILARDVGKLKSAVEDIKKACINEEQKVHFFSLDVTDNEAVVHIFNKIEEFEPIYMLVNCAGKAVCRKLEDMDVKDIKSILDLNILGTVFPTRFVISKFKERKEGIIVITASQAALIGIFGMSVYSASKFALKGFAEAVDMEVRPHNISVTLSLPPDTDTPGLKMENIGKPEETALICNQGGLFHPDTIAKHLLEDALNKKFFSYTGFESFCCTTLCAGMSPSGSVLECLLQSLCMGWFRMMSLFYIASFQRIIRNCLQKANKMK